jgi:hypothetical protein
MAAAITGDRTRTDTASARTGAPPELAVRLVSALLALAVAAVHVGRVKSRVTPTIACQSQGAAPRSSSPGAAGPGRGTGRHRLSGGCQVAGHHYQVAGQDYKLLRIRARACRS